MSEEAFKLTTLYYDRMRTKIYQLFLSVLFTSSVFSQELKHTNDDGHFFNTAYWNGIADKKHLSPSERDELISTQKNIFDEQHKHQHIDEKDIVWVQHPQQNQKGYNQAIINAGPCTNIDFESGTMAGWVRSTGFNPLFNAAGCCPNPNGDQTIMTGPGLDPYGNFPVVNPLGGSFSLRLGSTAVGGLADRISQTFFVTAANANFTYRYAVVLNDPTTGHTQAQKPKFTSEIIDTLGNVIPCTTYSVQAGTGIPGFTTSALTVNGNVISKNWTDVILDLTPNIGQNVTIQFTVYDCGPSGHFAYAYLDGLCTNFVTSIADTTCPNVPVTMCAPSGFSTTTWNGPGVVNDPNTCITAVLPGIYTCTTVIIPGCPGPTFTHTLITNPFPVLSFTAVNTGPCSTQYTFNSSSTIASGSIVSRVWSFGDGGTSVLTNPVHNYLSPGTYPVKLRATTNKGCMDSVINFITIFPFPTLAFSPPSNCVNTAIQFTNTSTISPGTITGYTWTLGNGATSNLINPTNTYTANGTYTITLKGVSNQGCQSTLSQTLGIFPPPIVGFTATPLCDVNGTTFSPFTSTAIASGSLTSFLWNFGDGGTSTLSTPVHVYNAPGIYTVSVFALSNHNCPGSFSNTFAISPSPNVAFNTTSVNACASNFTFVNTSTIAAPATANYTWNFGGANNSTLTSPSYTFPGIGNYTVRLIGNSNSGCKDTAFQYISIYPYPVINFSVPASCENAIFTVSTTAVSGSVTSYNWDFGDPASGAANTSTLQNPTHFYSATNPYTITLNLISNLNCPSSTIVPITVFPNPYSSIAVPLTLNNCSPGYTFSSAGSSVSAIGASSITAYKWNFAGVGTNTLANPGLINFPGNGTYSVSLIVTTNHNCSDTASTTITIHPFPQINFTVEPTCQNIPLTFSVTSNTISPIPLPGSSISSYTWNLGNGVFSGNVPPPPQTYTSSGTKTITFSGTSNMGCITTVTRTAIIHPTATINFTTTGNMCFGNITTFSSTTAPSATILAYNWDFGDGTTGSNPVTTHSYLTANSFPVTFSVTTNNECLTTLTKTISVHPIPVISFTSNGGCLNSLSQSQFTTSTNITTGTVSSWVWNFADGSPTLSSQFPSHTYSVFGAYVPTVTVTSDQGCTKTATNTVIVHPIPNIAFTPTGACVGTAIQFTNSSSVSPGSITSYSWDFADGGSSAANNPIHTYTASNVNPYVVILTATTNQGCVKTGTNNLTIHPYPEATVTPIKNSCINDIASINANISITGIGVIQTHTLYFGDGSFIIPGNLTYTAPHTYTAYNTYTVTVKAISTFGCAKVFDTTIVIYPKPFASFVANKFCFLDSTNFINTSSIPVGTIISHFWNFNDGAASSSSLVATKYKFSAPNIYTVSLTESSNPEPGLTCSQTYSLPITINPIPLPSFITNSACLGAPTNYTNTSPTNSVVGWTWDFDNDGIGNSNIINPSFQYTTAGTFTSNLIALNIFNCTNTVSNIVTVHANPTPSFVAQNACLDKAVTFNNLTIPGSGSSTNYTWAAANIPFSAVKDPTPQPFTQPGNYNVELTATSDLGCTKKYNSLISVYPLPTITVNYNEVCLNKPTFFTNFSSVIPGSIIKYRWDFENNGVWDDSTGVLATTNTVYPASGAYAFKLEATSNFSCVTTKLYNIQVRANPIANFTNRTLCANDKTNLTNLSSSSDGTINHNSWDFNGDNIFDLDAKDPSYTYTLSGSYLTKLIVTTEFGCTDSKVKTLYVNPKANAAYSSDKTDGCPPLCINFQNLSSISSGSILSTQWDLGDGNAVTTNKNPSACFNSGIYNLTFTVTSDSGCKTILSHPNYVTVYKTPIAGFKMEPPEIDEEEPIAEITNTSADAASVKYYVSDGSNYSTKDFTHQFKKLDGKTKPMIVQIVKNQNGCADTIFQVLEIKPAFVIYIPNVFTPNGDGTNDNFQAKGVGIIKFAMQIYDRWGRLVFKTTDILNTWDGSTRVGEDQIKEDVYTWKAQVTDILGKSHSLAGHVSVIR